MTDNFNDEINKLHAEFKSAIERNDTAAEKRLNDAMDKTEAKHREEMNQLEKLINRPTIEGKNTAEIKSFTDFCRGVTSEAEYKALSATGTNEGGVTIPKLIDATLNAALVDISPIRQIARVVAVPTPDYHIPFSPTGAASGWVSEKASRPETSAPSIVEIVVPFGELYANAMITQQIMDDSQFDMASELSIQTQTEFARAEGAAFVNGTGTNQPKGLLAATMVATADASRAFGSVQYVPSLQASALPTSADTFIDLVMSLKAGYRAGAVFLMSKAVLGGIRKYKDANGNYLWQPSLQAGVPSTFMGYPIYESEDMPAVGANAFPVLFGNFQRGYVIADRIGTRVLRDPYSNKPYISFYTTKRVGGCVVDSSALKALKVATS